MKTFRQFLDEGYDLQVDGVRFEDSMVGLMHAVTDYVDEVLVPEARRRADAEIAGKEKAP